MSDRRLKYRQAAFAYLLVGLLYESAVWVVYKRGLLPATRGPIGLWLLMGAAIVALVVWSLWRYEKPWIPRLIFALQALRLPTLIGGAWFPESSSSIPASFYGTALVIVVANLWMLARAGWDL